MAINKSVVVQYNIEARTADAQTIAVSAGFDCHAVITDIETIVADNHVAGAFRITAVIIVQVAVDIDTLYHNGVTQYRIDFPHGGIADGNAFNQHILAVIWLNEVRTEKTVIGTAPVVRRRFTVLTLRNRNIGLSLTKQLGTGSILCLNFSTVFIGAGVLPLMPNHGFRMRAVTNRCLTIQRAFASDCNILFAISIDKWGIVHQLNAFETSQCQTLVIDGIAIDFFHQITLIQAGIGGEFQNSILFNAQIDVILQMDGRGIEYFSIDSRNDNRTAAGAADVLNRSVNCLGIFLCKFCFGSCVCRRFFVGAFDDSKYIMCFCTVVYNGDRLTGKVSHLLFILKRV